MALYNGHSVNDISRSDASAINLISNIRCRFQKLFVFQKEISKINLFCNWSSRCW